MSSRPLALVTGGAHRVGRIFALALARRGYDLVLHYFRSADRAAQTRLEAEACGVNVTLARADLSRVSGIETLFRAVERAGAALTVLVNSAAVMSAGNVRTLSVEEWDAALAINLRAPFLLSQKAASRMSSGGLIVNIGDIGAQKTWTRFPAYVVGKAGLEALTRLLARALAPDIRVNAIALGLALRGDQVAPEEWDRLAARLPLRRPAEAGEIASALEFLLENEYITGHILTLDGGYSLL